MNTQSLFDFTWKFAAALWLMIISSAHAQPAIEAWVRRYGSLVNADDRAIKVVIDNAGNAFVAAVTDDGMNGDHLLIIKYSGTGLPLWTNRLGSVSPRDMTLDRNGDMFVAGTWSDGTSPEYATLKVSNTGVPLWTNRYHGPGNYDTPNAVAVDGSGNVVVTGQSLNGSIYDYLTIKYSGAGIPLWTNRGPGSSYTEASAVAMESSGNVFVTGTIGSYLVTVAYSTTGVPLWTNSYNGANSAVGTAVAADGNGNVLVMGSSDSDYYTAKYAAADGALLWEQHYDGPANGSDRATALVVDVSGNIFVTGYSDSGGGNYDFATVAYSSDGLELWANHFGGPGNAYDSASALAVDRSGNVFVTGHSDGGGGNLDYATVAYSSGGAALWTNRYNGPANDFDTAAAIAVDPSGNLVVTGTSSRTGYDESDCTTIKYSGAGVPLWTNRYNGLKGANDGATSIAVDGSGNVIVTGGPATLKYSSAGVALWTNAYSGDAVAADGTGNVFVMGATATVACSGGGVPLWTNYNNWRAVAVAVDSGGNVLVAVRNGGYETIKYSAAGVPLWTNRFIGPANDDEPVAIAVDTSRNVVVTGVSYNNGTGDYVTIKYSDPGVPVWTNRYNGPAHDHDEPYALAVDGTGNVFVAGRSWNGIDYDYGIVKISSAGLQQWVRNYTGYAYKSAVDSSGSVVVSGISSGSAYATIKYSGAGVPLWTNRFGANGNGDRPAIAVDGTGNVIVTGTSADGSFPSNYPFDYLTVAYSSAGVPLWTNRYDGPAHNGDYVRGVAVDSSGNVFVTGYSLGGNNNDYATIKYSVASFQPIPLNYQVVGNQLVLSWTNLAFSLQSAPAAQGNYTNLPGATSPHTNLISDSQRYFRLKAN